MKNDFRTLKLTALVSVILFSKTSIANEPFNYQLEIKHHSPKWIISDEIKPLQQREAKLAPTEQELALTLQPLLAKQNYQLALNAINNSDVAAPSPALLQVKGQILFALKRDKQAQEYFLLALKVLPDFVRAHRSLSIIYIKQEKYSLAQKHLIKSINLGGGNAQLYGNLAYINLQLNSPWSAISGYQKAMLLQPENKQWQQGLLFSLLKSNNIQATKSLLNEMLEEQPKNISLWLQRSQLSLNSQSPLEALSSMEMALRLGDKGISNQIATAQLHLKHGSISRATTLLNSVLKQWLNQPSKFDKSKFSAIESAIDWLVYENHWYEAKLLLKQANKFTKNLPKLQQSRLRLHHARMPGNSKNQIAEHFEAAIKLDPANGSALLHFAEHLQNNDQLSKAQLIYIRVASFPSFAERAYIGHAQVYIELQNYTEAAKKLRQALELSPTRQDLLSNIKILDRLSNSQI